MSILQANPSLRDTKGYLSLFAPVPRLPPKEKQNANAPATEPSTAEKKDVRPPDIATANALAASILNPVQKRTALVKLQGPFTERQLESIARGMVYLEKLGLLSVIVVENDRLSRGEDGERSMIVEDTMRVVSALEKQGARARPVLGAVVRLGPKHSRAIWYTSVLPFEPERSLCYPPWLSTPSVDRCASTVMM